jgi:hypothetical protein
VSGVGKKLSGLLVSHVLDRTAIEGKTLGMFDAPHTTRYLRQPNGEYHKVSWKMARRSFGHVDSALGRLWVTAYFPNTAGEVRGRPAALNDEQTRSVRTALHAAAQATGSGRLAARLNDVSHGDVSVPPHQTHALLDAFNSQVPNELKNPVFVVQSFGQKRSTRTNADVRRLVRALRSEFREEALTVRVDN